MSPSAYSRRGRNRCGRSPPNCRAGHLGRPYQYQHTSEAGPRKRARHVSAAPGGPILSLLWRICWHKHDLRYVFRVGPRENEQEQPATLTNQFDAQRPSGVIICPKCLDIALAFVCHYSWNAETQSRANSRPRIFKSIAAPPPPPSANDNVVGRGRS